MISAIINQSINVAWTILCYIPIVILWYLDYNAFAFWTILAISMIPLAFGEAVFNRFQLSNSKQFYRRLGISYFQRFTQKGMLAVKIIGAVDNSHKNFKRIDISKFKTEILGYEKYHYSCFLFFSLSAFYALYERLYVLLLLIFMSNIIYNVVPILIQQYNKLRICSLNQLISKIFHTNDFLS